jgi:hypothetical protein
MGHCHLEVQHIPTFVGHFNYFVVYGQTSYDRTGENWLTHLSRMKNKIIQPANGRRDGYGSFLILFGLDDGDYFGL